MILHIDMDAFFASIEQAVNPRLKGKPLIVGSREGKMHTVVCAASYEAKALGITSGMPSVEAFRLCPGLEFVPADQGKYIWASEQIYAMLKVYGFVLIYASIDEFQMDILDDPNPQGLAQEIQKQIYANFNITASIGIAKNWILAKLASKLNKPNGIAIIKEENLNQILARTPVEKLCGVGESTTKILHDLGVKTCQDLYFKSPQFLQENLGQNGLNLYASLHAHESFKGLEESLKPKSMGHSYTLPRPTQTPGFIQAWIRLLSEMVAVRLRNNNLTANTVHLWLNGPEIGNFGAQKTFEQATNDGYDICQRALKIMAKMASRIPKVRAIGVSCSSLSESLYSPLFIEQKRREELLKSLDSINCRFGNGTIYPGIIKFTHSNSYPQGNKQALQ